MSNRRNTSYVDEVKPSRRREWPKLRFWPFCVLWSFGFLCAKTAPHIQRANFNSTQKCPNFREVGEAQNCQNSRVRLFYVLSSFAFLIGLIFQFIDSVSILMSVSAHPDESVHY